MKTRYFCNAHCQHPLDTSEHECWEPLGCHPSPSCMHNWHHILLLHSKRAWWAHQARTCLLTLKIDRNVKPFPSVWPQQSAPDVQPGINVVSWEFSLQSCQDCCCRLAAGRVTAWLSRHFSEPTIFHVRGQCGRVGSGVQPGWSCLLPDLETKAFDRGKGAKHSWSQGTSEAVIQGVSRSAVGMGGERGAEGGGEERGELAGLFEYQALPHSRLRWQLHYLHI